MATVRHDLAHPLQAATLFLATMRHNPLPPTAQPLLDRTVASLKAMEDMLAGLREVTSLEAGGSEVHLQAIPLADILDQLAEEASMQAAATKNLGFRYVRSSAIVRTDPVLLARIVRNLLANAVRYTPRGRVLLGCRIAGGLVRIQVHDTGPGIPLKVQATIFDVFRRGSTVAGGVGLGLSIVRRLAAHLGHDIGFVSEEGKGSCFWVAVPLADNADWA